MTKTRTENRKLPEKSVVSDDGKDAARRFLSDGMKLDEDTSRVYNLTDEFAASSANKSVPLYKAIAWFTILLIAGTLWLTSGIQRGIDGIAVGINDFQDINLLDLLSSLKIAENELKNIDNKLAMEKRARDLEVEKIRREAELEIKKVEQSGLGDAEKKRLRREIQEEHEKKIKSTTSDYEKRIKDNEKKADDARDKMEKLKQKVADEKAEYDKNMALRVKTYEKEADNKILLSEKNEELQRITFEAELEKQKREYEALLAKYDRELKDSHNNSEKGMTDLHDMEQLLNLYKQALIYYARTRGEHGFVIDPGSKSEMLVVMNPYVAVHTGDQAYILNQDNKILALVELYPGETRIKAKIIKRIVDGEIKPFDKILLKKN